VKDSNFDLGSELPSQLRDLWKAPVPGDVIDQLVALAAFAR
jgi:hypothetical protein